jgi:DNA mismatch repair protein MutL
MSIPPRPRSVSVLRAALRKSGEAVRIENADRVKEAIEDFGMRNAGYPVTPEGRGVFGHSLPLRESPEVRDDARIGSQNGALFRSSLPTPNAELLYPLAQIHDSFIIAQSREGMALIDQHAAHERVLFERLQDQFKTGHVPVQHLLVPDQVELGPAQSVMLIEYLPELSRLGFLVEDFGSGTFVIKAVPAPLVGADYKQLLLDILDEVNVHGKSGRMDEVRDEMLSVMACHPAIKVHRRLDRQEMEKLLADLFKCRMPHTCPHGRPTIVRFSIAEIMKMFKRM